VNLQQRITEYVRACFTALWVQTLEPHDALTEIAATCHEQGWRLASWNIETGLSVAGEDNAATDGGDPLTAIRSLNTLATPTGTAVLVLENFHRFTQSAEIVQALARQIEAGKQNRTIIMVLSPVINIPIEIEKSFVVLEHELPRREQLEAILRGIATEPGELPEDSGLQAVLDAASGLTRVEAENAFSLSLVRNERITADDVWELKVQTLKKSGLLTLHRGMGDFSSLGGLSALKAFCKRALLHPSRDNPLKRARGVLLLSPAGCGKSQFCKILGSEVGRPVITVDIGSLMGSLVGQSEERTRQALATVDAMAPCVVHLDEVEKAFAGVGSSGDSGVASRMFGTFLSWLNDRESDTFVVCTSNDISKLPPEFGRSERFDGVFFLDLPDRNEKDAIWSIYRAMFEIDASDRLPTDTDWTGAEIKACCRLSALLDIPLVQAAQNVVPVAVTAAESVQRLRTWASGRCLSASQPGIYQATGTKSVSRRRVNREPSNN
jgi:hypothetical protein